MKKLKLPRGVSYSKAGLTALAVIVLLFIFLVRLGSLVHHLSLGEVQTSRAPVGFHGTYHSPLYMPMQLIRSVDFYLFRTHGQLLTRLPNVVFGLATVVMFSVLMQIWYGRRTAIIMSLLFATSAWTLHVSRLASNDVMYLFGIVGLLLAHALMTRKKVSLRAWYFNSLIWGILLTIPGFIWLVLADVYMQRDLIKPSFKEISKTTAQKVIALALFLIWLPLTIIDITRSGQLKLWLGLPQHLAGVGKLIKQFGAVFVHLFFRGPQYPQVWLGKAPVLDAFTLAMCLIGIYFYVSHRNSARARSLATLFLISVILVALNGAVSFSLVVPFAYVTAGMGVAYIFHSWFKTFPSNPLARGFGIGLVSLIVLVSCIYSLRAYFVAWPHNPVTVSTFRHRL
jgi:hypothetical protein